MRWVRDNLDGHPNFYSCSPDGAVVNWTVLESHLIATLITRVPFTRPGEDILTFIPINIAISPPAQ